MPLNTLRARGVVYAEDQPHGDAQGERSQPRQDREWSFQRPSLDLARRELTNYRRDGLESLTVKHWRERPTAFPMRLAVEREHGVLREYGQDSAVRSPG
jgi:hypothetical protein